MGGRDSNIRGWGSPLGCQILWLISHPVLSRPAATRILIHTSYEQPQCTENRSIKSLARSRSRGHNKYLISIIGSACIESRRKRKHSLLRVSPVLTAYETERERKKSVRNLSTDDWGCVESHFYFISHVYLSHSAWSDLIWGKQLNSISLAV